MLTSPTLDKLRDLNLLGMSRAYKEQIERADYQALGFDDRLGMLVDVELQERENRRLHRYLKPKAGWAEPHPLVATDDVPAHIRHGQRNPRRP
jgi:hypothetical protein